MLPEPAGQPGDAPAAERGRRGLTLTYKRVYFEVYPSAAGRVRRGGPLPRWGVGSATLATVAGNPLLMRRRGSPVWLATAPLPAGSHPSGRGASAVAARRDAEACAGREADPWASIYIKPLHRESGAARASRGARSPRRDDRSCRWLRPFSAHDATRRWLARQSRRGRVEVYNGADGAMRLAIRARIMLAPARHACDTLRAGRPRQSVADACDGRRFTTSGGLCRRINVKCTRRSTGRLSRMV